MNNPETAAVLARLQRLIDAGEGILGTERQIDSDDDLFEPPLVVIDEYRLAGWSPQCLVFLDDIAKHTYYSSHASYYLAAGGLGGTRKALSLLRALKEDVEEGYLTTFRERIHADVFSNFLEMAEYLLSDGFNGPAVVLIGGVLEQHLRELCTKHQIPIEVTVGKDKKPKKAEAMNTDLYKQQVYSLGDQKQVTAWLDLRNNAAHGKFDVCTPDRVSLMLQGVQSFLVRYPA